MSIERYAIENISSAAGVKIGGFTDNNTVDLLSKGPDTFSRIFNAVKQARNIICLEFYIFRNDETGQELADMLKERARSGVSVYLLYDHMGSFGTPREFWSDLKGSGVKVMASRPFKWSAPLRYVHRDHKKLIIIDGITAFTGGLNIANEYRGWIPGLKYRGRAAWRDTGVLMQGPVASALLTEFKRAWFAWGGEPFEYIPKIEKQSAGVSAIPIFAQSNKGRRRMRRLLYYSINNAEREICLTTAYFTPSRMMMISLEDAIRRGVRVRLLLPGKSDVPAAHYTGRAFFTRLLRCGAEIYAYKGDMLHAKTYIFDRHWSVVGSANLDFRSLRRNDEGNVGIFDNGFAMKMIDMFENDIRDSDMIELDAWLKRPVCEKIMESGYSLFRRRL